MPSYVKDIIYKSKEWDEGINNDIIPKIKKFEGKLLFTQEIKPKLTMTNNAIALKNVLGSMIANLISGKNNIVKKEEPSSNYDDVNYWKVKNTLSLEEQDKVYLNKIKNKEGKNDIDDETELLDIAMKLEDEEYKKTNNLKISISPKFNFIKKKEISISPTEIPFNTNKDKKIEIKNNEEIKTTPELKNEIKKEEEIKTTPELKNDTKKEDENKTDSELINNDKKEDENKIDSELKNETKNKEETLNNSELKNEIKKEDENKTTPELIKDTKKEDENKTTPELKNDTKKEDENKIDSELKNNTQNKEEIETTPELKNETKKEDENK